jgi:hypothetical protein
VTTDLTPVTITAPKARVSAYYENGVVTSIEVEVSNDELTVEELALIIERLAQLAPPVAAPPAVEQEASPFPLMPPEPTDPLAESGPSGPGVQLMSSSWPPRETT